MNFSFPKDLYTDVRIEETTSSNYSIYNNEVMNNSKWATTGAIIRIFDGKLWYTSTTDDVSMIQSEIDNLATLVKPNPNILKNKIVKNFQVNKDCIKNYDGDNDNRKVTKTQMEEIVKHYLKECSIKDDAIKQVSSNIYVMHKIKSFYSSKGSEIVYDTQECGFGLNFCVVYNDIPTWVGKHYTKFDFEGLKNHEEEIIKELKRGIDFAKNAVDIEPGDYPCVLAPVVTAMFTHECFGHKSEADFMLNDKTLQNEWIMGKKVGSELVSICDRGDLKNHGYTPYDDEGNKATETWLIKNGILTGRLHDAKSASVLKEKITGNSRAENYYCTPIVRMTNTYMENGKDSPEELISKIENGIFVYSVYYGTGNSTFTMKPMFSYRIKDGKIAEPVRVNVVTGSVFRTLFDITGVGNDFELIDSFTCGKGGQSVPVSAGGPTISVKKLNVN